MRRRSTFFSLPSVLIFGVLLVGLGLTIWRQGGRAFSPGDLGSTGNPEVIIAGYESHADFEGQCSLCHQPLNGLLKRRRTLDRQRASLAQARRLMALWHKLHVPLGLALFAAAFVHIGAAIYYATLLR